MKNDTQYNLDRLVVSVIIPAYNMKHCIFKCIESVLKQGIDNMEVIIVDDCSKDGTKDALNKYIKKKGVQASIVPIYLEKNMGVSNARNVGIQAARGEYIHCVDADDLVPPQVYKKLIKCVYENHTDIIAGNYIFKSLDITQNIRYKSNTGLGRCLENNNLSLCNKWFRKKFTIENELWLDTSMKTAEDAMFCLQLLRKNPSISYIDEEIYQYQYDDMDHERHRHRDLHISSIESSLKVLKENFIIEIPDETEELWAKAYLNYIGFIYNTLWSKMLDFDEKKEAYYKIKETLQFIQKNNRKLNLWMYENKWIFNTVFFCSYETFYAISYEQYLMLMANAESKRDMLQGDIAQRFVAACARGHVGMRMILKAARAWMKYKILKG